MLKLKPAFLKRDGKKQFVVLSIEDFERIQEALEDVEDLRILEKSKRRGAGAPMTSHAEMKRLLGISSSRKRKAS
jgi:hypothetical protein